VSVVDQLQKELDAVQAQLDGYEDLIGQRDRLAAALAILKGESGSATQPVGRRQWSGNGSTRIEDAEIIHALHVLAKPASAIAIREQMKLPSDSAQRLSVKLKKMTDEGLLKAQGQKRARKYEVA
jgi:hypothetical protein